MKRWVRLLWEKLESISKEHRTPNEMDRYTISCKERLNSIKMSILPKLIHKANAVLIEISLECNRSQFMQRNRRPRTGKVVYPSGSIMTERISY